MKRTTTWALATGGLATLSVLLVACGGGGGGGSTATSTPAAPVTYTVGGTVSGLSGTGLVLQNNAGNNLSVSANGTFAFTTAMTSGSAYAVSVQTQPSGQTCTVSSGSGTVGSTNVTSVAVSCLVRVTISGGVALTVPATLAATMDQETGTIGLQPAAGISSPVDTDVSVGIYVSVDPNPLGLSITDYYDGDPGSELGSAVQSLTVAGRNASKFIPPETLAGDVVVIVPFGTSFLHILDHGAAFQDNGQFNQVLNTISVGN